MTAAAPPPAGAVAERPAAKTSGTRAHPPRITEKPQVLLLYPKTGIDFGSTVAPPHALLTVAAPLLHAGYNVKILDQRVEPVTEEILKQYISSDLIAVGISTMTGMQIHFAILLAKRVRELTGGGVPIVWGGCHPTVTPEQTLEHPNCDIVAIGEGDEILLDIVEKIVAKEPLDSIPGIMFKNGGKAVSTAIRPLLGVNELLPTPWHLVNVENYIHKDMYLRDRTRVLDIGQSSRGCPFDCGFCSSAEIRQRKWRALSTDNAIELIVDHCRRFKLDGFWLRDDEFYINRRRSNAIFEGMIKAGLDVSFYTSGTRCDVFAKATEEEVATMKRAGAHTLKFGAESGSQRVLDLMQKGITIDQTHAANERCKRHGIAPCFGLLIGYPTETFEEIDATISLGAKLKTDNPRAELETMTTYTALPGTPDWRLAIEHGLQPPKSLEDWTSFNFDEYDLEGTKIPWFNRQERIWIGNITYMSILAHSLGNVMSSARNPVTRAMVTAATKPVSAYYRYKLWNKQYRHMPDLAAIRYLRERVFYKSEYTVK